MNTFCYQGKKIIKNYYEGWYIRLIDTNHNLSYSIIFGITLYEEDPHSFIQIINGQTKKSEYLRFTVNDFSYSDKTIKIKDNELHPLGLKLKTKNLSIDITTKNLEFIGKNQVVPSTMGLLKYLPLCSKHEIIYIKAKATGKINDNNQEYNFDGLSYMEKNWGNKFPKKWVWTQTNHFEKNNAQFIFVYTEVSIFDIPAFFCILTIKGVEHRFTQFNSQINILKIDDKEIIINLSKGELKLNIKINYDEEYPLIAPIKNGRMIRVIGESINSKLSVSLYKKTKIIFKDNATNVGCENLFKDK